jgi:cysteinyl-tRNA synthetase
LLKIFNTLTKKIENFQPIDASNVRMYVCGPTVYDKIHIGNGRSLIVFDVLFRILRKIYGEKSVTYVRNITDIDDKIIAKSQELKLSVLEVAEKNIIQFKKDANKLNLLNPTIEPKATDYIEEMGDIIKNLIANDFAYIKNKHVYFNVKKYAKYGNLSNKKLDENIDGIRVLVSENKIDKNDFVLWKPANIDEVYYIVDGLEYGRPGWHIECSAMAYKLLGATFDIHGGGLDLMFPHHENEIAQSCCCFKTDTLANYFIHNGFLNFNDVKMSKSLGNVMLIDEFEMDLEIFRLAILLTNYSHPLNFNSDTILLAKNILDKFYEIMKIDKIDFDDNKIDNIFLDHLKNNMNTVLAIKRLQELLANLKKEVDLEKKNYLKTVIFSSMNFIGLMQKNYNEYQNNNNTKKGDVKMMDNDKIEKLIEERFQAKLARDFAKADKIRDDLLANGILLQDVRGQKTTWTYKK